MYEMRKCGRYGIGFIDPNTINEDIWKYPFYEAGVEESMVEFLRRLNSNEDILLLTTSRESHCLVLQILFLLTS